MIRISISLFCVCAMGAQVLVSAGCGSPSLLSSSPGVSGGSGSGSSSGGGSGSGSGSGSGGSTGSGSGSSGGAGSGSGSGSGGSSGGGTGSGSGSGSGSATGTGSGSGSGGGSSSATTSPAEYLYATANEQQGSIYEFQINATSGALTASQGSPFKADIGTPTYVCTNFCGSSLVADPLGRYLYFQYNYGSVTGLDSLSVDGTSGALSSASQYGQSVYELAAAPQGNVLFWNGSSNQTNELGGVNVAGNGGLTSSPGQPYPFGGQSSYGAPALSSGYAFAIDYTPKQGALVEFAIDAATGALTMTSNSLPLQEAANPVVTPSGKFIYAEQIYFDSTGTGHYEFVPIQVGSGGALTTLTQDIQQTPDYGPPLVWMSPNGNFLWANVNGQLWDYQINSSTGALTLVQKYADINPGVVAIDPAAQFAFMNLANSSNVAGTTITAYSVNSTTGAVTPVANGTVDLKAIPIGMAVMAPPPQ